MTTSSSISIFRATLSILNDSLQSFVNHHSKVLVRRDFTAG